VVRLVVVIPPTLGEVATVGLAAVGLCVCGLKIDTEKAKTSGTTMTARTTMNA
jgi:hypothetical protein